MTADIITLYIQIFCIITFTLYLVYVLAVIPLYKSLPLKIVKIYNSVMFDFAIFMAILMVFYILNYLIFHIKHSLFISIELMITLSSGVLLSTVISYFAVNSFNISKPAAYILYLFLFIFLFVLYIAVIFKPFY
ncbi:hypothetical protein [Mucispirillum schaedleri]|uniref:hypothetical protein n=1 Tax=Mucispirillum schaedleri TaxID=248039 RepID=UPI001F588B11|nr:hypothetical protein [Mucispirillum schaedleri]